jgi:heme A synthase
VTLLAQAPLALALMHQSMAMIVLTAAVVHVQRVAAAESISAGASADSSEGFGAVAGG